MRVTFWVGAALLAIGVVVMYWGTTTYLTIGGVTDPAGSASNFITGLIVVSISGLPIAVGVLLVFRSLRS